jgi:hypothetical protein
MQPNNTDASLYVTGARNANLDHFSLYMHTRWIYLHNRIARWIAQYNASEPAPTIFNAARVFVQAIARNMLQDFIGPFGSFSDRLPIGYNTADIQVKGIPPEFLLVSWFDSFQDKFSRYVEVAPSLKIFVQNEASYRSTIYNTTLVQSEPVWVSLSSNVDAQLFTTVPKLGILGYNGMYNQALFGGSYSDSVRCGTGAPFGGSGEQYDIVATAIQRGRDNVFPSCNGFRQAHGLPNITFSDFGAGPFAQTFAALHNYDVSTVELATCLLLDSRLRNQMVASLMTAVLDLDAPTSLPCNSGSAPQYNFGNTAVANLSFYAAPPVVLANLMNLICKNDTVRVNMRALVELEALRLDSRGVYLASNWNQSKYFECTTADPFFSAYGRFQTRLSQSSFVMEDNSLSKHDCNWRDRIEVNTSSNVASDTTYWLSNTPACQSLSAPASTNRVRQCFDPTSTVDASTQCFGRGTLTGSTCDCDYGWVTNSVPTPSGSGNLQINNVSVVPNTVVLACEHWRYPRNSHIPNYFAAVAGGCSQTLYPNPPSTPFSVLTSTATSYCTSQNTSRTVCKDVTGIGTLAWGGCHSADKPDLGRAFSLLGRILPPVYPNGISCPNCSTNQSAFTQEFHQRYPVNSSNLTHNALWRAVGMLLVRDIFSNPTTNTNVNGSRSATSTANPAQFQNTVTGWIDASPLYGNPTNALPTSPQLSIISTGVNYFFTNASLQPRYSGLTQEEKHLLTLLATRHNQLFTSMGFFSNTQSDALNSIGSLCARELVMEEWRAITAEFINASRCYFRTFRGDSNPAKFNFSQHREAVPIEAGAARIFQLHHTPQGLATACSVNPALAAGAPFDRTCLVNMASTNLNVQANISGLSTTDFSSINVAQLYGLPAVDAYVTALGRSFDYTGSISPNLLLGLHKSSANYAINFGLIESILNEQRSVRDATTSCMRYAGSDYTAQMTGYMPGGVLAIPRVTSLAGMLDALTSSGATYGTGPSSPRADLFYDAGACA